MTQKGRKNKQEQIQTKKKKREKKRRKKKGKKNEKVKKRKKEKKRQQKKEEKKSSTSTREGGVTNFWGEGVSNRMVSITRVRTFDQVDFEFHGCFLLCCSAEQ